MAQVTSDPGAPTDAEDVIFRNLRVWGNVGFNGSTPAAQHAAIADPSGGVTVDAEARTAINGILAALQTTGIIAT
ncbi:MAG: hypothetical protein IIA92_13785 [Chloroflexi bacterium]|nr:hypothetical protein [Chloroflexota bacterium]